MNKLIALIAGQKAADAFLKVRDFLKGKKAMAVGVLTMLQGIVGVWSTIAGMDSLAQLVELARHSGQNPDIQMIMAGLAVITLRRGMDNAAATAAPVIVSQSANDPIVMRQEQKNG
jgi:hypothetical protein